jgi:radical SAM superfamily enzyme YgiQ (UPF0313 family)
MNILYVVKGISIVEPLGVLQVSAVTRDLGHRSFLGVIDHGDVLGKIEEHSVDLVAYSMLSTEANAFLRISREIRARHPDLPIIAGGPHPTYFPQLVDSWPINAVVVGEADQAIVPLLKAIEARADFSGLPNVHTREHKNEPMALIEDLDSVPFPDRELTAGIEPLKSVGMKTFMATRGCPYSCSYCFNNAYKVLYKGKGPLCRRRSVENLITEIEEVQRAYPMSYLRFGDDVFVSRPGAWLDEFVEKYKARVGVPFYCLIRPNLVSEEIVGRLKEAGCRSVAISLESGNESLRKQVLNRAISDEVLLKAYAILRDHDIKIFSNVMLGLPEATLADDKRSLDLTFACRPTYASFTVFTPFPGTELYRLCKENGDLPDSFEEGEYPESTLQDSCLRHVTEQEKRIHRNILMLGALANWQPWLRPLLLRLIFSCRPNVVFGAVGFVVRNHLQRKIWPFRLSPLKFLLVALRVWAIDKRNYALRKPQHGDFGAAVRGERP